MADSDQRSNPSEIDAALDAALDRLPRYAAPATLADQLRRQLLDGDGGDHAASRAALAHDGGAAKPPPRRRRANVGVAALTGALVGALSVFLVIRLAPPRPGAPRMDRAASTMVAEAVNDHIRVVSSVHPVEIESGGIHQVKPWFTGRLEFAPRVAFSGDEEFPLVGGSIGYFVDRKAAVFVFKRRLHTITLLVFPADGLPWPTRGLVPLGPLSVSEDSVRGFSVLLWQEQGLGYALVSDVNRRDLEALAERLDREN